jgi:hypothetical protein
MKPHYFALLVLTLGAIGCNTSEHSNGAQNKAPMANTATTRLNPNRDVSAAFDNLKTQPFVTAKIDNEGTPTKRDELIEAAGPEKVRRVYLDTPGFEPTPSDPSEIVQIGEDIFEKRSSGEWVKVTYETTVFGDMTIQALRGIDFKHTGDDTIDGKQVSVYSSEFKSPGSKDFAAKVWIHADKQVPLKAHIDWPDGSSTSYFYDLDTPIKPIEAPKVVKKT